MHVIHELLDMQIVDGPAPQKNTPGVEMPDDTVRVECRDCFAPVPRRAGIGYNKAASV